MTLFILFEGLAVLICAGATLVKTAFTSFSGTHIDFEIQSEYVASLSLFFAAVIVFSANRFARERSTRIDRASASSWRKRIVILAFLLFGSGLTILLATTRQPGDAITCASVGAEQRVKPSPATGPP